MTDTVREVLDAVAAGTLSPAEASALLAARQGVPDSAASTSDVRRLMIKGQAVKLSVLGDPSVADAVVDGPHEVRREGDALVITTRVVHEQDNSDPPKSAFMNWVNQMVDRVGTPLPALTVRVNPSLPLEVLVAGGTLDLGGTKAATSIGVEAGSATINDGIGPLQLDVSTGSAKVGWTFTGESRIRVEMGSVVVAVRPESDVQVCCEASLGQATITTATQSIKAPSDGLSRAINVGAGSGALTVRARMGSAQITLD